MTDIAPMGDEAKLRPMDEHAGSWFLVTWPEHGSPVIEMEFWTREEAQAALEAAQRIRDRARGSGERSTTGVCPAAALINDPFLQNALIAWDEGLEELESIERLVMRGG
jgi:hypothetical protein